MDQTNFIEKDSTQEVIIHVFCVTFFLLHVLCLMALFLQDMKEVLDQNDLLEFQMTELQNDKKVSLH